jgi:UDP-N-acetyl-D-mannosaminuronate dehydrogenase
LAGPVVLIVGLGEVGRPLSEILQKTYECVAVDIQPVSVNRPCSVMHVCYPFQIKDFAGTTARYTEQYRPELVIINSTVAPGTTRKVSEAIKGVPVVYSPVRGKHARMVSDMLKYAKFVAGFDAGSSQAAEEHFRKAGFKTDRFRTPEIAETSKLLETTYLGVLIAWAQEVERIAKHAGASFDEVNAFIKEIDFLPSHVFPGVIGGHCVMPNIAILKTQLKSDFLNLIEMSDEQKRKESGVPA